MVNHSWKSNGPVIASEKMTPGKGSRFNKWWADTQTLLDENAPQLQGWRSKLHRFVHFWLMVGRSFNQNRCPVRATALAYATLLALIPMLAVVVSVTSAFLKTEGEDRIDQFIEKVVATITPPTLLGARGATAPSDTGSALAGTATTNQGFAEESAPLASAEDPGRVEAGTNAPSLASAVTAANQQATASFLRHEEVVTARRKVAREINQFIQNTRSGALGVTGSLLLIFAAISMLSRIEMTFNDIWGVTRGRSWFMRIVLYWGVITLAPLLLVVAVGLASGPHMAKTRELLAFSPFLGSLLYGVLPILMLCLGFSAFYLLMPNTKVHWRAALAGGVTAGLLFHLNNLFSVLYVSRVVSNSRIYGSLGLVPVFMIGLYFSWLLLLFGAQVAYGWQNRETYLEEKLSENINQRGREFIALRLMTSIGHRFSLAQPPPSVTELSRQLVVPSRLVRQILQTLVAARLVVEVVALETAYMPAKPLEDITCHDVLQAMRATHGHELETREEPARREVYGEFVRIQEAERNAASKVSLLALVHRAEASQAKALEMPVISDDGSQPNQRG